MATITTDPPSWKEQLQDECQKRGYPDPIYNIVSDRRGGRTAWSSTVTVNSKNIAARAWYDGQYLEKAREDAAQVACGRLRNPEAAGDQPASDGRGSNGGGSGWNR